MTNLLTRVVLLAFVVQPLSAAKYSALLGAEVPLANVVGPMEFLGTSKQLPIHVEPYIEHVRETVPGAPTKGVRTLRFDEAGSLVVVTDAGSLRLG